jgi:sulfur-carrier protein
VTPAPGVTLRLPSALADVAGGRSLVVEPAPADVGALLDEVEAVNPALARRIRDETGAVRRFVNVYVDGDDIRHVAGTATPLRAGAEVHVLPSVAGG